MVVFGVTGRAIVGMAGGSPGMETMGRAPYTTLPILHDGSTPVFGRHNSGRPQGAFAPGAGP